MRFIYTKAFVLFFASLVLLLLFSFMEAKGWLGPVREVFVQAPRPIVALTRAVTRPVRGFFSTIYRLKDISKENDELTQKVAKLEQSLVDQNQFKYENEILRKELGFVHSNKYTTIPCSIIAQNPSGLMQTAIINCGQDKGVEEGRAVVSQGYLVGKVIVAGKNSSTVLLSNNSKFSTDAKVSQTSETGIVEGSFSSGMMLDRLSQNANLERGWLVTTGGIDTNIPKNIVIGEVGQVLSGPNDSFKRATLLSPIDFNNLDFVFVVK